MIHRPPYRADHVGSLLRPQELAAARQRQRTGDLAAAALREIEDRHIRTVVTRQEAAGLSGITDGELRRSMFHLDFLRQLAGVEIVYGEFSASFRHNDGSVVNFRPPTMYVRSALRHVAPIQGADYDYLASVTTRTPKVCIPSPSMLHFRGGRDAIDSQVYPRLDDFFDDLTAAYRDEIADLTARGCRYLQFDDTNLGYICDPAIRDKTRERGDDPDELVRTYCRLINDAIRDKPADMTTAVHLCRGNFKSAWVSQGGYDPVAEILFNELNVDGFFLEYDDERSGDFAPLRFVPAGKRIVLGLLSSKYPVLEDIDEVLRRIDEATAYVPLEQCAISHQCGFSSTEDGNQLSADDQWRKLAHCVEIARRVWDYSPIGS